MSKHRIWSAPRGVLIDNYGNAYTTHGAVEHLNRLEAELAAAITRAKTAEAKLSNIRDNIALIGKLVCPSGHGAIECPDIDPLMGEYICKCGDVLHEHTETIAVSNIRAILEVTP